eukprot:1190689-Prorocentrum_minimum.AAC.2
MLRGLAGGTCEAHGHELGGLLVDDIHGPAEGVAARHRVRGRLHHQHRVSQRRMRLGQLGGQLGHTLLLPGPTTQAPDANL